MPGIGLLLRHYTSVKHASCQLPFVYPTAITLQQITYPFYGHPHISLGSLLVGIVQEPEESGYEQQPAGSCHLCSFEPCASRQLLSRKPMA